jgi:uncharacterized protein YbdZ (MbtH family)
MSWWEKEDTTIYKVVVNHEEQYSIWPANRENALGWKDVGRTGNKQECLDYIKEVWTDMRPLSLRKKMEEAEQRAKTAPPEPEGEPGKTQKTEPTLVQRLAEGEHPVEASLRPEKTPEALKKCIDRGYVHVKFTKTRGGTDLGVPLDREGTDLSKADFQNRTGTVHLEGNLTLDYVKVKCIADIDLTTLEGMGRLVPLQ